MSVDKSHPVFDRFDVAGYRRELLTDPGLVRREHIEDSDVTWRAVRVKSTVGVEAFDVENVIDSDHSPSGVAAVLSYGEQPIGFADEHGALNDHLPSPEKLDSGARATITMMWPGAAERSYPDMDRSEAVEALSWWGSEGFLPLGTARAIAEPFGATVTDSAARDDPDVAGEKIVRASLVAPRLASAEYGEAESADSGLGGHKKTRRQRFYRNLEKLQDDYGDE